MHDKRLLAYAVLLITAITWGIASPVIKYTLQFIEPFSFLFWRFLLTSVVFLPIFFIYKAKKSIKLKSSDLIRLSLMGFLGTTFTLGLLFIGYKYTTAIDGSLIYSVAPIMVVIGGVLFLKEEVTAQEKLGTLLAFAGSVVTIIQPVLEGKAFALKNFSGNLIIFASAVVWATYSILLRKFETRKKDNPVILTSISFFTGLITITPLFLYEQWLANDYLKSIYLSSRSMLQLNPAALPGILYMSLLSSVVAYFTYNLGYSLIEASEATIFEYLKPVFAAPLAYFWLGEAITLPFLIGAALIASGVFLTEYRRKATKET